MSELKRMYQVLEQMVLGAEKRNVEQVLELNNEYATLAGRVYHKPLTPLEFEYDNCRVSCVMSVTMLSDRHTELVLNAKERLSRIPKPLE